MLNTREWFEKNRKIYDMDKICVNCHSTENLTLHHIVPLIKGGTNLKTNVVYLCEDCHGKTHGIDWTNHSELIKEGMKKARENGIKIGRSPTTFETLPEIFIKKYPLYAEGKLTVTTLAKECNSTRQTMYKYISIYEKNLVKV